MSDGEVVKTRDKDRATLLREAKEWAGELRASLAMEVRPADSSPTHKVPFKVRILRETLLHRVSDLSDAAILHYESASTIPAFVLTRAAFETMAMLFYANRTIGEVVAKGDPAGMDGAAMRLLFGSKDKSLHPPEPHLVFEAVNILTALDHLDKKFAGLKQMFTFLCEFAHPNHLGVLAAYQQALPEGSLRTSKGTIKLGPRASNVAPEFGLVCLRVAIGMAGNYAKELMKLDADVRKLCESVPRPKYYETATAWPPPADASGEGGRVS